MKTNFSFFVGLVGIVVPMSSSCHGAEEHHSGQEEHAHADEIVLTDAQARQIGIQTDTIRPAAFAGVLRASGQILPGIGDEQVVAATAAGIFTPGSGTLTEGAVVRAGQPLGSISNRNLPDGDPMRKAQLACEAAEREWKRAETLVKDQIISQKAYEQSRLQYETAKAAYEGAAAQWHNGATSVTSPIGGYIKSLSVKAGDYVEVGTPLLTVTQSRRLRLQADVAETDYALARQIRTARFRTAGSQQTYDLRQLNGRLLSYARSATPGNPYLPVTFEFDNIGDFVEGSYADVYLLLESGQQALSVPIAALTEEQGLHYVYLAVPDEPLTYRKQEVRTGQNDGQRIEITEGLKPGDIVVTQGSIGLKLASLSATIPDGHNH